MFFNIFELIKDIIYYYIFYSGVYVYYVVDV